MPHCISHRLQEMLVPTAAIQTKRKGKSSAPSKKPGSSSFKKKMGQCRAESSLPSLHFFSVQRWPKNKAWLGKVKLSIALQLKTVGRLKLAHALHWWQLSCHLPLVFSGLRDWWLTSTLMHPGSSLFSTVSAVWSTGPEIYNLSESVHCRYSAIYSLDNNQPCILTSTLVQQEERSSLVVPSLLWVKFSWALSLISGWQILPKSISQFLTGKIVFIRSKYSKCKRH